MIKTRKSRYIANPFAHKVSLALKLSLIIRLYTHLLLQARARCVEHHHLLHHCDLLRACLYRHLLPDLPLCLVKLANNFNLLTSSAAFFAASSSRRVCSASTPAKRSSSSSSCEYFRSASSC